MRGPEVGRTVEGVSSVDLIGCGEKVSYGGKHIIRHCWWGVVRGKKIGEGKKKRKETRYTLGVSGSPLLHSK